MLETDPHSQRRLLSLAAFMILLFGGFALYGTIQRSQHSPVNGIGDPAPVTEDRAAFLAQRRVWFKARQAMAKHGKKERWANAIAVADDYLMREEDMSIQLLRWEAALRSQDARAGATIAALLEKANKVSTSESALLREDTQRYKDAVAQRIRETDEARASAEDANNSAWQAAFADNDSEILAKAIRLSERSVAVARAPQPDPNILPLYLNTLGGLYIRAGRYADALRVLSESEQLHHDIFNAPFFALAYHGRGEDRKANAWRERLRNHLNDTYATRDSQENRQELLLLWREIEQTVKETPSRATNGTDYGI